MTPSVMILIIVICLILSSVCSASEMAMSSCSRVRLEHMADNGSRAAKAVLYILDHFEDALSALLLGNNLVNITASAVASILVIHLAGPQYTWVATLILTVCVIVTGETIPKILAQKNATRFSLGLSKFVRFLMIILKPFTFLVVKLAGLITRPLKGERDTDEELAVEELHTIIETAEDEDVLDEDTSELVSAAIDFSDVMAQDVMTARVDLTALNLEDSPYEQYRLITESGHTRIPVYEDSIDNCIGVLHVNHYLKALTVETGEGDLPPAGGEEGDIRQAAFEERLSRVDLKSLLMPVIYVYKTIRLPYILSQLQNSHQQLAVVTDEYGGTLGLVTIEDILEELVGEIWDETDTVETPLTKREDGSFEVDGDMLLEDLAEYFDWNKDGFHYESDTVGGWCIEMLGNFPEVGESFLFRNCRVEILETEDRRVRKVMVKENVR